MSRKSIKPKTKKVETKKVHKDEDKKSKSYGPKISTSHIHVGPSLIPNAGYGVFADKDFKKGDIIERAPYLEVDTPYNNELMHYVFQSHINPNKSLVVFGYGSIYNHSNKPNILYSVNAQLPSDRLFIYSALKNIKKGDELFINYGKMHPINEQIASQKKKKTIILKERPSRTKTKRRLK